MDHTGACIFLYILFGICTVFAAPEKSCNCLSDGALAGLVFGCIFATIIVCSVAALALWYMKNRRDIRSSAKVTYQQGEGYAAYDNPDFRDENGAIDHGKNNSVVAVENGSREKRDNFLSGVLSGNRKPHPPLEATKSTESLTSVREIIKVELKSQDFTGLGFNIHGNMRDGIFVKEVLSRGPAKDCGKIHSGDRILRATVSFENMVFEDALTILSYASPYAVTLEIQKLDSKTSSVTARKLSKAKPSSSRRKAQLHPLFKSQSIDDISLSYDRSESLINGHEIVKNSRRTKNVQENHTNSSPKGNKAKQLSIAAMESISEETPKLTVKAEVERSAEGLQDKTAASSLPAQIRIKDDPYADLTPEERMQVLRLSYEDPELSQSTPNLYHAVAKNMEEISLNAEVLEPSDTEGKVSPEHHKLEKAPRLEESDADSIDLSAAKEKLQARKALLMEDLPIIGNKSPPEHKKKLVGDFKEEIPSKICPSVPNDIGFESFEIAEISENPVSPPTLPQTPPPPLSPPQSPGVSKLTNGVPRPIVAETVILNPSMERSNWLRPSGTADSFDPNRPDLRNPTSNRLRRQMAGTMSLPTSDDDQSAIRINGTVNGTGQSLDSYDGLGNNNAGPEFDKEQYQKLLYFQQQLAKQHEELTKMGIHIPMNLGPLGKQGQGSGTNGEIITNGVH